MSQNPSDKATKSVPISVWGGLVTNVNPTSLPLGASPKCSDMTFLQESVASRPGLKKVFAESWGLVAVNYGKSYVDPTGIIRNLYLTSAGNFYVENLTVSPGTYTLLFTTTPGSYAKSTTAFGREYIAINDGLHGADIAYQYDGTHLERVTQDGPGAPPVVTSLAYPEVAMAVTGSGVALTIVTTAGGYKPAHSTIYVQMNVFVTSGASAIVPYQTVTITGAGNSAADGTWTVLYIINDGEFIVAYGSTTNPAGSGGTATFGAAVTMVRNANIVTVFTAAAHNLQVGYQAQIIGVPAAVVGTAITSIVIDNEDSPGLATITTSSPHGLTPNLYVSLQGIAGTSVGGGITAISRQSQITTVTTATPHGLNPGGIVTISGVATASFDTTAVVQLIVDQLNFTFIQVDVDATDTTGVVTLDWPVPATPTPTYFQVQSAPTPTTFQIQVFYSDGSWSGGTVAYAWDGIFFVKSVPSTTSFTYQQYGPNTATASVGDVIPYGQASPGIHQCRVSFETDQGYVTEPSPPVQFVANGSQYISVANIPIGPSNIVARILQFTGAQGAYFFYIPSSPQVNGQIVGTSTQLNDNTTTAIVLDFSDNTLFASLGTSIDGNNLAEQIIIDGALGFGFYDERLITYGQRNRVINLLNMGFDGGYQITAPTIPTGWVVSGAAGGALATGHYGFGWQFGGSGNISQGFYEDAIGDPIAQPNTLYTFRAWLSGSGSATLAMSSASTSFSATATINVGATPFQQANFSAMTPATIPSDLILTLTGATALIDDMSMIYAQTPFLTGLYGSYVDNPESFDGVTGVFGPADDINQVLDIAIIRGNLFMLTRDPGGRLHETSEGNTEPAGWTVNQISTNCGAVSAFCLTVSQADDGTGEGGEEFFAWVSSSGIRIFGGQAPDKISQEIQRPIGVNFPGSPQDLSAINPAALLTVWGLNDPTQKMMWFGIPLGSATSPSSIFMMSYLGMDSAAQIAGEDPISLSRTGKMFVKDLSRKWCPWARPMNGAALMYREADQLQPVFFGNGYGNVYTLNAGYLTDDDYGQINPYYFTAGIPDSDTKTQLQLMGDMFLVAYASGSIEGTGILTISMYYGNLGNLWPISGAYTLAVTPFDLPFGGGNCQGPRVFFGFSTAPNGGTDNGFTLSAFVAYMKESRMRTRGVYP